MKDFRSRKESVNGLFLVFRCMINPIDRGMVMSIVSFCGSSSCVMVLVEDEGDISKSFITCCLLSLASVHSLLLMVTRALTTVRGMYGLNRLVLLFGLMLLM